ncbi:MAG: LytTR family DNA-binding domain-containing protein [Rhodothermales bacterium]
MRTLLVDDEPPARHLLRDYLRDFDDVDVIGECSNGREALEAIASLSPDLVFLDIQMPGLTGFEVIEQLGAATDQPLPRIIFCTAYDQFALEAFNAGAVDYLLKPYTKARFAQAVQRALNQSPTQAAQQVEAVLQRARPPQPGQPLLVRVADRIRAVPPDAIRYAEAAGDYTDLHLTDGETVVCSLGIGALAERLGPTFRRIHRSTLIALAALHHLRSDGQGGYIATLTDGTRLRVSRSYAADLRDQIV